ncbi:FAD-dependent thymidylate synthase [Nocardioides sp. Leaf285]|uniref:FAD-dependent thymidylate synthase n=1 Tax=Nocardioides sp. Leaf285 TaxID=1736322 RepID=UPI000702C256|nr:FAD-dependent thymidylate synthase [Nocardioides sp. Leaf285]KQP62960.1 hypothetical protein ASF47_18280 [Nocardioides sp. Leaf285]
MTTTAQPAHQHSAMHGGPGAEQGLRDPGASYAPDGFEPTAADDFVYAKVIAHSVSPEGVEIVTFEKRHHRWVLSEDNTHATPAKNSASSRARPIAKVIDDIRAHPAVPVVWASEQKGMQGGEAVSAEAQAVARRKWDLHREATIKLGFELRELGVHKSITNRLLEPHSMHTSVWTGTAFENYFAQRCHPDAQPEIRVVAERMRSALADSTPTPVARGEFHLPYIDAEDRDRARHAAARKVATDPVAEAVATHGIEQTLARVSAARVARTSYMTQDGVRALDVDLGLYARLADERLDSGQPPHWSPLEQIAIPCPENRQAVPLLAMGPDGKTLSYPTDHLPRVGKFTAWLSMRHIVEAQRNMTTYR